MKRLFFAISTLLLLLTASCGHKNMFILQGTVQDDTDTILVLGIDSRFDRIDTIVCQNGKFIWKYRPDTVTALIMLLPDGRRHPVFAEKNVKAVMDIPSREGLFNVSGGYCNDSYQSFYQASWNDTTMEQTYARIDSFITRDPFSEVTPYLIYEQMVQRYHADEKSISKLISRISGNMQDAPYLTTLKSEFAGQTSDIYLNSWTIKDSVGKSVQFANIGSSTEFILLYVWATWNGQKALQERRELDSLKNRYAGRKLVITDISIDVNADSWKNTIAQDSLAWSSYNDVNGWESRGIKTCKISGIPAYVLFSGTKRMVYNTTSLSNLDKELDRLLPRKDEQKEEPKVIIQKEEPKKELNAKRITPKQIKK